MARLALKLLGGFTIAVGDRAVAAPAGRKTQALLAYLALHPGQPQPRDKLAALLWAGTAPQQARNSLRQALFAIRKTLLATTPQCLLIDADVVALNPGIVDLDVVGFERAVAAGSPEDLDRALTLYQGELLDGFAVPEAAFEAWLFAERDRLREVALDGTGRLLAHLAAHGPLDRAVQVAGRMLALDPLRESAHRTLMELYVRQGRRSAAIKQYQNLTVLLRRELDVAPEMATTQLYEDVLRARRTPRGAPSTAAAGAPATPATTATGPVEGRDVAPRAAVTPPRFAPAAPLVGRDQELARLRYALHDALGGRGGAVAVIGEAGIGKTRLVEALALEGLEKGGAVLIGRAHESERILPFAPWVAAVREAGLTAGGAPAGLDVAWRDELARLFPELGPGVRISIESEDYLRLFEALVQLLARVAAAHPIVLVLEDLHWADELSVRLVGFFARRIARLPILLVVTTRDEELVAAPVLRHLLHELSYARQLTEILLAPLLKTDVERLVGALAAGTRAPARTELVNAAWALSEGNPLMVVECVRAGTDTALPPRVREMITRGLDRLSERARQLLAVAAVMGDGMDFAILQRASGLGELDAAEAVEELVRRRILRESGRRFDFTHARVRDVALAQLLPPRRHALTSRVSKARQTLSGA